MTIVVADVRPPVRRSFKRRLLLLVAIAVALPALATCVVLGLQLDSRARTLFANGLKNDLETYSLLMQDQQRNLVEGVRRAAADNTLQVTLELEIKAQLTAYIEAQRQILGVGVLAAYDNKDAVAASVPPSSAALWHLAAEGAGPGACTASRDAEVQLVTCQGTSYLVSVFPIRRAREGLGDAAAGRGAQLGHLLGATPVPAPALLAALKERQLGPHLIWIDDDLVYSSLGRIPTPPMIADAQVRQHEIDGTAYLGAARTASLGTRSLGLGLLAPLAPLQRALLESVATVAGIGIAVVVLTLLALQAFAGRMLRPIGQLQEGAQRIGQGELAHRIAVDSGDELQALAGQFNAMSERLQQSYAQLEGRVEDRTRELSDALRQQVAVAEILRVISRSKFDTAPVFEALVESAPRLCNADSAFLLQRSAAGYDVVAESGFSPQHRDFLRADPAVAQRLALIQRTEADASAIQIGGAAADGGASGPLVARGFGALLGVPMLRDGEIIGVLVLARLAAQSFGDDQVALMRTFADQAAIAIENVRLFEEVQARTRELAQSRLRRFLAPQVAELLVASGEKDVVIESRRSEVTVVFCDLRGFTAFAETSEPEDVMAVLREYHAALGDLIFRFEGTLERFVGDGLLVVFNDPLPIPDHPARAVRMAIAMRECMQRLQAEWHRQGHDLGFGIGIAQGYATVGPIGFDRRLDYAVIGSIPNMASRLCDAAAPGQILISQRVQVSVESNVELGPVQHLTLKGFPRAVASYEVLGWRDS